MPNWERLINVKVTTPAGKAGLFLKDVNFLIPRYRYQAWKEQILWENLILEWSGDEYRGVIVITCASIKTYEQIVSDLDIISV